MKKKNSAKAGTLTFISEREYRSPQSLPVFKARIEEEEGKQ